MMNVCDDRQWRTRNDVSQTFGSLLFITGTSNDVTTGSGKRVDLLQRSFDIGGLRRCHRLNRDRRATTDGDATDAQLTGCPSRIPTLGRELAHIVEVRATA